MFYRKLSRAAISVAALSVVLFAISAPASAHVRVSADTTAKGSFAKLTFRVPTESATASTTKVEIDLPQSTPFAFVSTKPVGGWTVESTETPLAKPITTEGFTVSKVVSKVVWTAGDGQGVAPGQFQEFEMSVGPLPDTGDSVSFTALQTYSDGTVVSWSDPPKADGTEAEHPAPSFELTKATSAAGDDDATPVAASSDSNDSGARTLGVVGIIIGGLGFIVAFAALVIARGTRRS